MAACLKALWRLCMLAAALALVQAGPAAAAPVVQVVHNGFVSAEKFVGLQGFATQAGVALRHVDVDRADDAALRQAVASAALVVLDVPRPNDRAAVSQRLAGMPASVPRLVVGGGRPAWEGLTSEQGGALAALYAAGGQENFGRFFALASAASQGTTPASELLAPPTRLPAIGFYHPAAPQIFGRAGDYLGWDASRRRGTAPAGRIGFLAHRGAVADLLTRELDALIARTEQAGLQPLVFWFDSAKGPGLDAVLQDAGIDVLVNVTHMQNGEARLREIQALDVPVLQTLRFREGEAAAWPDAPSGVSARTTAVFLAQPEAWGLSDPLVLSASTRGVDDLLPGQADALIDKLRSMVALRRTAPADKRLALMFWNYPAGEKNLGASNLNVPASIVSIQAALRQAGHAVGEPLAETDVIKTAQRMMGALYGGVSLDTLAAEGLAGCYPLVDYEAWLGTLPPARQAELLHNGPPARHRAVSEIDGRQCFVIPRWQVGNLLVMPQLPRDGAQHQHYHDTASAPDHAYLAAYLYLQRAYGAHALIHLGTHGTQEWLPGKDRGLAATDYPWLAVGSLPVFYPYIQDNVGEAIQAKRRGRAVVISHQTPPFAPAGLYDTLRELHQLIHEHQQLDEGMVRNEVDARIRATAIAAHLHDDLGWPAQQVESDFPRFLQRLHDHLHELARTAVPLGLHRFGQPASIEHRISTIMQQLGEPFYDALGVERDELFAGSHEALRDNLAYLVVRDALARPAGNAPQDLAPGLAPFAERARELDARLRDTQENEALVAALAGRFVAPGAGGDPVRDPGVRSGRNLYAFEADKIPTRAAFASGTTAYAQTVESFRAEHGGAAPRKLAFSLWSSEAIRHLGVTEAQILHALGLRPVWDAAGRVTALEIVPADELGRPRTDVVVQVTGVYRDQFDSFMRLLDDAMIRLAALDEPDNPVAANNRRVAAALQQQGMDAQQAEAAARHRIFGSAPGSYGTGVPELALRSTEWEDDTELAKRFLASGRHALGAQTDIDTPAQANLFAEQLRGTEAAIMSRSSNVHGVLSTDHPFEFLGGLSAAIRHLDGKAPQLLISDLRTPQPRTAGLARFLADEMRGRYLNPQWIGAMQQEGYAGTLEVLKVTNNLFGWQAMDASTVRADQWQAMVDTYVTDTRQLGTREWFEQHNPTAQAQMIERMAEAIRKGYWDAPDETRQALAERWQQLARDFDVDTGAPQPTRRFIADMARGFGVDGGTAPAAEAATAPADPIDQTKPTQTVSGQVLQPMPDMPPEDPSPPWALAAMLLMVLSGGLYQAFSAGGPRDFRKPESRPMRTQ